MVEQVTERALNYLPIFLPFQLQWRAPEPKLALLKVPCQPSIPTYCLLGKVQPFPVETEHQLAVLNQVNHVDVSYDNIRVS